MVQAGELFVPKGGRVRLLIWGTQIIIQVLLFKHALLNDIARHRIPTL